MNFYTRPELDKIGGLEKAKVSDKEIGVYAQRDKGVRYVLTRREWSRGYPNNSNS